MADAVFRVGYGNLYGPYSKTDKDGLARYDAWAEMITLMKVSFFCALELHEESDMHKLFVENYMPSQFTLADGQDGGNHVIYDERKFRLLQTRLFEMKAPTKSPRMGTSFNFEHLSTGVRFWATVAHLTAGGASTKVPEDQLESGAKRGTDYNDVRCAEVESLLDHTHTLGRHFIAIDRNSSTSAKGYPQDLLIKAGYPGLRNRVDVVNGWMDTHGSQWYVPVDTGQTGEWIEDIHTNAKYTEVRSARLYPTAVGMPPRAVSDHTAFIQATIAIKD